MIHIDKEFKEMPTGVIVVEKQWEWLTTSFIVLKACSLPIILC